MTSRLLDPAWDPKRQDKVETARQRRHRVREEIAALHAERERATRKKESEERRRVYRREWMRRRRAWVGNLHELTCLSPQNCDCAVLTVMKRRGEAA